MPGSVGAVTFLLLKKFARLGTTYGGTRRIGRYRA